MPIRDKVSFTRKAPPANLEKDETMYFFHQTEEAFRNYDEFFERFISCNSLCWTCSITGKSGLTFREAKASEEAARESLRTFPAALRKPVMYLARFTSRSRINDVCDDVFNFIKDRYFVGEEVEAHINGIKRSCEVTQVLSPEQKVVKSSPSKPEPSKPKKAKEIPAAKMKYEVTDFKSGKVTLVKPEYINRPKGILTKPRTKLYLKHHTQPVDGIWQVKESVIQKQELDEFQFSEVFSGQLPTYALNVDKKKNLDKNKNTGKKMQNDSAKKSVQGKLNFKKESMDERRKNLEKEAAAEKQRLLYEEQRAKFLETKKKEMEELKEKQRLKKLDEKIKKQEEKRKLAELIIAWKQPRDDLECDDLKELPSPIPIDCKFPQSCFGDAIMILEFLNTFEKQVQVKTFFSHGLNFALIERALVETDIQGVLNDLLQLFLSAIFRYQEAEDDVYVSKKMQWHDLDNLDVNKAMVNAAISSKWPKKYHGTLLRNLQLDAFSVSEILRLHLLSSGPKSRISWQGQIVGPSEDPGLYFKLEEPELLKRLASSSVFEFGPEERCKILTVLVHQLLSLDVLRYAVDEFADQTRPLRNELKQVKCDILRVRKLEIQNNCKMKIENKEGETNGETQPEKPASPEVEKKDKDKASTPEQSEDLEKKEKEYAKELTDFLRREKEIKRTIHKLQMSFNITPVGRDRAFRRYWIFQTIAGVFVEDNDPHKGGCLSKPTIQKVPPSMDVKVHADGNSAGNLKKYFQQKESKSSSSDKENDASMDVQVLQNGIASSPMKSNRRLSDLNPRIDSNRKSSTETNLSESCLLCKNVKKEHDDKQFLHCPHSKGQLPLDQCSANYDTCSVHNVNAPRMQWAFYHTEEDLNNLLLSLNDRGFREKALKEALVQEKDRIKQSMSTFQYFTAFNQGLDVPLPEVRKSQRRHYGPKPSTYSKMVPRQALEVTLRDMILELEHQIFYGGLGALKKKDREKWREAIEKDAINLENNGLNKEDEEEDEEKDDEDIKMSETKITPQIPVEEVVRDLAQALCDLAHGIEPKYLNPPLGESEESKKKRSLAAATEEPDKKKGENEESKKKKNSAAAAEEADKKKAPSALELWETSLFETTSLSQVFVYLNTLESSVAWNRSVLNTSCRICRRKKDGESMLLCDGCNRGHHMYCLKPPLKAIPEGDWFCVTCKPIEKPETPQKKPGKHHDSDDSSEESEEDEEAEDESGEEEGSESEEEAGEWCEKCGDVGELLCCDRCPKMYHAECVDLKRIPRGEWLCPACTKKETSGRRSDRNSNGTKSTKSSEKKSDSKAKSGNKKKRSYEDTFNDDFSPPSKKSTRERRSAQSETDRNSSSKKDSKDPGQGSSRRRSKIADGETAFDYSGCVDLMTELMKHEASWPFLVPVNKKDVPDYYDHIKKPMDFGTVRSKLNFINYKSNLDFLQDVYLVLQNCEWYNQKYSAEYKCAQTLHKELKKLVCQYELCSPLTINTIIQLNRDQAH